MKKHNKLYGCPMPDGSCLFIVAKDDRHMRKIHKKKLFDSCYTSDEFSNWGKFSKLSISWEQRLSKFAENSGSAYYSSYGNRYEL